MALHKAVSITALHRALYASALGILACSGETAESPQLQHGFAPLCGDPQPDAGLPVDPTDAAAPTPVFDCQVHLSKLSYDSPGADVAEFLELHIEGTVDSQGQRATLGDCGLDHMALLNGADASCASYRQIPLAELPVPNDGYVVLCSSDAQAALGGTCDFTSWGNSRLSNGWLQNGPTDVVTLVGTNTTHYAYEGVPTQCGDPSWRELPADTGEIIDGVDDVIAACGEDFLRISLTQAPLRQPAQCPIATQPDAGTTSSVAPVGNGGASNPSPMGQAAASSNGTDGASDAGSPGTVELFDASVAAPGSIPTPQESAPPPPLWHNYGATADAGPPTASEPPPLAPSCQLGVGRASPRGGPAALGITILALAAGFRRRASSQSA